MKHKNFAHHIIITTTVLLFFIIQAPVLAQTKSYTLEAAINTAINNNKDISFSVMTVKKAGAAVDEAFGYALPSVNLNGSFSRFLEKPKMPFPDFGTMLTSTVNRILNEENVNGNSTRPTPIPETILQTFSQTNNFSVQKWHPARYVRSHPPVNALDESA